MTFLMARPSTGPALCRSLGLMSSRRSPKKKGKHRLLIEPYGYRWYRIGGLDYLLRRSDIEQAANS